MIFFNNCKPVKLDIKKDKKVTPIFLSPPKFI